jgi:peptide/nickel transport system ATP-binding protein
VRAVDGVSFNLRTGERLGLVGESGSGKSTVAMALMRLIKPPGRIESGQALFEGADLLALPEQEMRRLRLAAIALVAQGAMNSLNPVTRVRRQFADALRDHGQGLTRSALDARIRELLSTVGLGPEVADKYPHELSGGMKQRVVIAIAISLRARVIIADEPTSALDVTVQAEILDLLRRVREERGMSVLFISHDLAVIAELCDRVAVMQLGRIVEEGPTARVLGEPEDDYTKRLVAAVPKIGVQA